MKIGTYIRQYALSYIKTIDKAFAAKGQIQFCKHLVIRSHARLKAQKDSCIQLGDYVTLRENCELAAEGVAAYGWRDLILSTVIR